MQSKRLVRALLQPGGVLVGIVVFLSVAILIFSMFQRSRSTPTTSRPDESSPYAPASITLVPGAEDVVGSAAWIDDWIVVEIVEPAHGVGFQSEPNAYSSRIWKLHPDGSAAEMLALPNSHHCDEERHGFERPVGLPDGRMGYILRCAVKRDALLDLEEYHELAKARLYMLGL